MSPDSNKHTPGPWKVHKGVCNYHLILSCDDVEISECGGNFTRMDHQANANLIASAPELLEQLEHAVNELEHSGYYHDHPSLVKMRSVIAKAKGE